MSKLIAEETLHESQTCLVGISIWSCYAFMRTFFTGVLGYECLRAHFSNQKRPACPPSSPTTQTVTMGEKRKLDSEKTSVLKDWAFHQWADERLSPSQSLWKKKKKKKKQPMKISSTVQFREPYKSILVSTHISVWGEFICLITERRCPGPGFTHYSKIYERRREPG